MSTATTQPLRVPTRPDLTTRLAIAVRTRMPLVGLRVAVGLIYVFLYLPVAVIALYAFSAATAMRWPIEGFTLSWFSSAFSDPDLTQGLRNTFTVGLTSTALALVLGVPAGFALDRFAFPGKTAFQRVLMAPFLLPGVVSGMALLALFLELGTQLSLMTVIIAHTTMLLGVFVILTLVSLSRWDRSYEQAAMDLGANELQTFWHVVLPNLRGALMGAALLGLTVSLDETTRTFFVTGTDNTFPMVVMSRLRTDVSPEINAIGTTIVGTSLLLIAAWALLVRKRSL
jgi:spermidine/putrescine transport system permease protein